MKAAKRIALIFFIIVVIVNFPFVNKQLLHDIDNSHTRYSNLNASFTRQESFGFKNPYISNWSINRFNDEMHPTPENATVYRLYRINPLCFWRWHYYIFISRNFKYHNWEEIEKNRVPYNPDNMWQDF